MGLQTDGVKLVAEGANQFVSDLNKATGSWDKAALSFGKGLASGAGEALGLNTAIGALSGGMTTLGMAAGSAAVNIGKKLAGAIGDVAEAIIGLAVAEAKEQGLGVQFESLAGTYAGGADAMLEALQKASGGLVSADDLMIRFNETATLLGTQFAQRLPEAMTYLRKVSFATGQSMSDSINAISSAVGFLSPRMLRQMNIQLTMEEVTAAATKQFHKQAEALTEEEQQAAMYELILQKLAETTANLPDPTGSASEALQIMDSTLADISDQFGNFFVPALGEAANAINTLLGYILSAISEGGDLYPVLVDIGAVLEMWASGFGLAIDWIVKFLDTLDGEVTTGLTSTVENMFTFGVEMVAALAEGISQAASTVLVQAMDAIGSILTFWLGPGSPPRVAPDLDKWGIAAFTEFLHGMTEADFDVLKSVQGPLQKILEGPEFADLSKSLAKSLAGDDRGAVLDALRKSSSVFGSEIATLAERQFALADATDAVAVAEKAVLDSENALKAARKASTKSQKDVSAEVAKYNELLRQGASRDVLDAQLQRINASEAERAAAMDNAEAAEDAVDAAKERLDLTKAQQEDAKSALDLQQQIVDQMTTAQTELTPQTEAEREEKAKKEKAGFIPGAGGPAGVPVLDIGGKIGASIEEAKKKIMAKIGEMLQPLKDAWKNIKDDLDAVGRKWTEFSAIVGRAWDAIKAKAAEVWTGTVIPIWQQVELFWVLHLRPVFDALAEVWAATGQKVLQIVTGIWQAQVIPMLNTVWDTITTKVIPAITDLADRWKTGMKLEMEAVIGFVNEVWIPGFNKLLELLGLAKTGYVDPLAISFGNIGSVLDRLSEKLRILADKIRNMKLPDWMTPGSPTPWELGLRGVNDAMRQLARTGMPELTVGMAQMQPTYQPRAFAPTYATAGAGAAAGANVNLSFGNVILNNDMDWFEFREKVQRAVKEVL